MEGSGCCPRHPHPGGLPQGTGSVVAVAAVAVAAAKPERPGLGLGPGLGPGPGLELELGLGPGPGPGPGPPLLLPPPPAPAAGDQEGCVCACVSSGTFPGGDGKGVEGRKEGLLFCFKWNNMDTEVFWNLTGSPLKPLSGLTTGWTREGDLYRVTVGIHLAQGTLSFSPRSLNGTT